MTSRDFVYWLQGLFELAKPEQLNAEQTELIRRHLQLVFIHEIDPSFPEKEELQKVHDGELPRHELTEEQRAAFAKLVEEAKKHAQPPPMPRSSATPYGDILTKRFMC